MGFLSSNISRIEQLISEGTHQSLTYAALECRLAIEFFCYDRLRLAHEYVSHDDLLKWQPKDIVKTLISEVFKYTDSEIVVSISKEPIDVNRSYSDASDFEQHDFQVIGRQSKFDPKKLGKIWNSLSSFLHIRLPKSHLDELPLYGDIEKLKSKVSEALEEIKNIDRGDMFMSGFGEEVHFYCACGTKNKRRASLLSHGKVVSCINAACEEKHTVEINGEEINFIRQIIDLKCKSCGNINTIAKSPVLKMPYDHVGRVVCKCGDNIIIRWRLSIANSAKEDT